jgi:hypothetical protein
MKLYIPFLIVSVLVLSGCSSGGGDGGSAASDTTTTLDEGPTSLDLIQFNSEHFAGSGNCNECHTQLKDAGGNDVSMDADWRSTMMANAARDPLWQAKLASEANRHPALKSVIEEKCSHCHTPMAERQSIFDSGNIDNTKLLDDGFLNPENRYHEMGMDGVSCSLCHQIEDSHDLGEQESFSGHFSIDETTAKPNRKIYGPYLNVMTTLMQRNVGFIPTGSAHIESSKVCATCHTLYTPTVDDNGDVVGEIAEQAAYLEWEHSDFSDGVGGDDKSCQQCHMPLAEGAVQLIKQPRGGQVAKRSPFYKHHFVGGNAYMVNLIKEHADEIGVTAEESHFDATISRTIEQLENHTARVSIDDITEDGDVLEIPVTVTVLTGHKFPTGIPSRRAWIHLRVSTANGTVIFESGAVNAEGKISGCDADEDLSAIEPHYDIIDSSDKVQVYESIMANVNDQATYTLLRGAYYAKDNRLLPKGFDKTTAVDDIGVFGAASVDDNFIGGSDKVTYRVDTSGYSGQVTIEAVLNYQAISHPFYADMIKDSEDEPLVKRFKDFYEATDSYKSGIAISTASVSYTK